MINFNDPVTRLVGSVLLLGLGILLTTAIPFGFIAFAALAGVVYYFFTKKKNT